MELKTKKITMLLLFYFFIVPLRMYPSTIAQYPTPEFNKVELICKELWSDLDTLLFDQTLQGKWIEQSDYLINQFIMLYRSVNNLIAGQEQSSYLLEDIHYLQEIIRELEKRYSVLSKTVDHDTIRSIASFLDQVHDGLEMLVMVNQEVVLITP